jgi:hypothetical protein
MERYKCIRNYPGGPGKDVVVYHPHKEVAYKDRYFKQKNEENSRNYIFFDEDYVKKFPKYWKKI